MKYLIGTGYHPHRSSDWLYAVWLDNTLKYTDAAAIVVMADSGSNPSVVYPRERVRWLSLPGDTGHIYDLLARRKPYDWCGWSMVVCATALMAYAAECDYIHKESDCLAFGPWVERMYAEAGDYGVLFGSARAARAVQSLFMVKHWYIPEFVRLYLGAGNDSLWDNRGEEKFFRLEHEHPKWWGRYSFGYDRDRPINMADEVFYAQKLTPEELLAFERKGLVTLPKPIPDVEHFTGDPKNELP